MIAVTGGSGFVGRKLVSALVERGHKVRVLSRSARESDNPSVEFAAVDYADVNYITAALEGCDTVYHLAAAIFAYNYAGFEKANVKTARTLVSACNRSGVRRVIMVSSLAAAGFSPDPSKPRVETDAPAPASDYGITKLGAERELDKLRKEIQRTVFRPPIVYGKNDSGVSKIASWVKRGLMVNTADPNAYFSFIYVDDLVDALCASLEKKETYGQTYFVCEEKNYTWTNFINMMAAKMGREKVKLISAPLWLLKTVAFFYETAARIFGFEPALNYDKIKEAVVPGHWICSPAKWVALTGQKFTPLEQGLEKSFK